MNYFFKIAVVVFISTVVLSCSSTPKPNAPAKLGNYRVHKLSNGLNILMIKDDKLPYLTINAFVMNGYAVDPKNQTGLTSATLNMLDKGYNGLSAEKISAEIEQLGAEFDVEVSADYSLVNLDGLSWQENQLLTILSNVLLKPDFNEKELQRYKTRTVAEVKQRLDQLTYLATEIYDDEFYKNHPYGHRDLGSIADIKQINRKELLSQYQKVVVPQNTWIVVVGQFSDDLSQKIDTVFSEWKNPAAPAKPVLTKTQDPAIAPIKGRDILLVDKSDAAQAEVRIGRPMISRHDPDYVSAMVANTILGQGFSSRLMNVIRVQQGLTYNISSEMDMRVLGSGLKIKTFTKNESAGKIVSEIYKVTEDFYKKGVTQEELDTAKNYLIGKFPMLIETAEKLAFNIMVLKLFKLPDEYLTNYQENVARVNLKDINNVIKKDFDPQNLKVVIVANKNKVLDQLKPLGKVDVIEANSYLR